MKNLKFKKLNLLYLVLLCVIAYGVGVRTERIRLIEYIELTYPVTDSNEALHIETHGANSPAIYSPDSNVTIRYNNVEWP